MCPWIWIVMLWHVMSAQYSPLHAHSDPWYICIGGFPEETSSAPRTLTIYHGKTTRLLSTTSTILDVLNLPSSPYPYGKQEKQLQSSVASSSWKKSPSSIRVAEDEPKSGVEGQRRSIV